MKLLKLSLVLAATIATLSAVAEEKGDPGSVCDRNPWVRESIEISLKKFCHRITAEDLYFVDPAFSVGYWEEDGEANDLRGHDLEGLVRLRTFSFNSPLARVHSDVFDHVPNLLGANLRPPQVLERLNPHPKLRALGLKGDYKHRVAIGNIADEAFSRLSELAALSLDLDMSRVNLAKALAGVTTLTSFSIGFQRTSQVPADAVRFISLNPKLSNLDIAVYGGKIGPALAQIQAMGFQCFDNSEKPSNDEKIWCRK